MNDLRDKIYRTIRKMKAKGMIQSKIDPDRK